MTWSPVNKKVTEESDMYLMRTVWAGRYVFVKTYTPKGFGAPLKQRMRRMRETPKAMKKYNDQKRAEKLQMLILNNFDKGYHITLDYPKGQKPATYEEAEKNLTTCLYKVSRRLKKQGKKFKYLAVTERGKRAAALHHHMVIEHDQDILHELLEVWGQHMHISVMYEEGQYEELAEYLIKAETKEELTKGKSKYHRSRNLDEPVEKTALISGDFDKPFVPEGYELMRNSLKGGFNDIVGVKWQKYMLRMLPKAAGPEPKKQKCTKGESIWSRIKSKILGRKK